MTVRRPPPWLRWKATAAALAMLLPACRGGSPAPDAESTSTPQPGGTITVVGAYDPNSEPPKVEFNEERLNYWLKTGATPSETVADLIKRAAKNAPPAA